MEVSAAFPVDLSQLAEGVREAAGPAAICEPCSFAALLAGKAAAETLTDTGESLPPGGESLPPDGQIPAPPFAVLPVPAVLVRLPAVALPEAVPGSAGGARSDAPLPGLGDRKDRHPARPALLPLRAAIAQALAGDSRGVSDPSAPAAAPDAPEAGKAMPGKAAVGNAAPNAAQQESVPLLRLSAAAADDDTPPPPSSRVPAAPPGPVVGDAGVPAVTAEPALAVRLASGREPQETEARSVSVHVARLPGADRAEPGGQAAARAESFAAVVELSHGPARAEKPAPVPDTPAQQFDLDPDAGPEQLAARIRWLADRQVGEARLRLNPPELGALDIRLSVVDDETFVQITAQATGARELLEASLHRLRALLGDGGLSLGGASVDGGRRGHDHPVVAESVEPVPPPVAAKSSEHAIARAPASAGSGRLDLYA